MNKNNVNFALPLSKFASQQCNNHSYSEKDIFINPLSLTITCIDDSWVGNDVKHTYKLLATCSSTLGFVLIFNFLL